MDRNYMVIFAALFAATAVLPASGQSTRKVCTDVAGPRIDRAITGNCTTEECTVDSDCTGTNQKCCDVVGTCETEFPEGALGQCTNATTGVFLNAGRNFCNASEDNVPGVCPTGSYCCIVKQQQTDDAVTGGPNACQTEDGFLLFNTFDCEDTGCQQAKTECHRFRLPCTCNVRYGVCRNSTGQCAPDCACREDNNCPPGYTCCRPSRATECACAKPETPEPECPCSLEPICRNNATPCKYNKDCEGNELCCEHLVKTSQTCPLNILFGYLPSNLVSYGSSGQSYTIEKYCTSPEEY